MMRVIKAKTRRYQDREPQKLVRGSISKETILY